MEQGGNKEVIPILREGDLIRIVHDVYSATAKSGPMDSLNSSRIAEAFGYTPEQLQSIPTESHMGLSCGNPVAAATIKEGETVLDLGSGGGIDVLLAASKVGPHGQVIGLDMSSDMIHLARRNAQKQNLRPPQVAFVQASLTEPLPIETGSIDCILSNCVINLLPPTGKGSLLKEIHRVLKPGGRIVLDDIIAKQPLPEEIRDNLAAYVSCIAGAIQLEDYRKLLADAGFSDSLIINTHGDLNIHRQNGTPLSNCCGSLAPLPGLDANTWVASYQIYALKLGVTSSQEAPSPLLRWWDAYPTVKSSPALISSDELAGLLRDPNKNGLDYAVIDVRRNDHAGGHVRGSFQCPAQTFHDDLPTFFEKFGKTNRVIFYCGSSSGRGPRCAGWYQDYLDEREVNNSVAYVLQGGVKAWLAKFGNDEGLVDRD